MIYNLRDWYKVNSSNPITSDTKKLIIGFFPIIKVVTGQRGSDENPVQKISLSQINGDADRIESRCP